MLHFSLFVFCSQALLTLLISNNFAEIKSSVFKKFDKHNLFQLSCHDVVERFKLALFLAMIMLLNVCQGGLDDPVSQARGFVACGFSVQLWGLYMPVNGTQSTTLSYSNTVVQHK